MKNNNKDYVVVIISIFYYHLLYNSVCGGGGVMVFNATFNSISVIIMPHSWQSVLLMEETRVPGENHQLAASH